MKPFYAKNLNDWVINEVCQCGHTKDEHGSLVKNVGNKILRLAEEGSCCGGHCECMQFTFAKYLTAGELAEITHVAV